MQPWRTCFLLVRPPLWSCLHTGTLHFTDQNDHENDCENHLEKDCKNHYEKDCENQYEKACENHYEKDCENHYEKDSENHHEKDCENPKKTVKIIMRNIMKIIKRKVMKIIMRKIVKIQRRQIFETPFSLPRARCIFPEQGQNFSPPPLILPINGNFPVECFFSAKVFKLFKSTPITDRH